MSHQSSVLGGDAIDRFARTASDDVAQQEPGLFDQLNALGDIESQKGEREAAHKSSVAAGRRVDVDAGTFERQTRGFDLSERQKAGAKKRIGLARSIAQADASGSTRRRFEDAAKGVRRAAGGISDALFGQRLQFGSEQASEFSQQKAADARRKADKRAATIGTIGKIAGMAAMFMFSSEDLKDKQGAPEGLLKKLSKVRVEKWNYKKATRRHIGPFAEEFNDTFEVNQDNRGVINVIDALGVTLGAIKELDAKVESRGY